LSDIVFFNTGHVFCSYLLIFLTQIKYLDTNIQEHSTLTHKIDN